jgi:hypothetical protein
MINISGTGCRIKKILKKKNFFQKQQKNKNFFPKTTKNKKFFDVTMLLILVNYSSSNPKSLIN